ncbi:MAG: beta-lactamase family protein [Chloroflexi bacterium]|nr:beta-lactamase family protein [Chloroflexota bacterium]MCI0784188.1 beta-lactamase family protein [Chloroflexota bacterium]MCI0814889.1 beta-lactamase family protein [Chloroflexota bacterium]MCI0820490.1 beta-lactamase family protein [Chloroflexota bacterium]MCI0832096.1 beta-lactamase family protein [Chloroflexota bacterium]
MRLAPTKAGFSPERLERITDHLTKHYIDPGKIAGCQTLVARHGHAAYFRSLGFMDRERGRPMADDTIFRLFSMTKPITSVALMTLYERGLFQLNDPVHRIIPEWRDMTVYVSGEGEQMQTRAPTRPMTIGHLLSHQSGLSYGGGLQRLVGASAPLHPADAAYVSSGVHRDRGETLRSFVEKLSNVPLRFDPGDSWMYSYATDVCGYLVEAMSGMPFDQYLQETIFEPLGMSDTAFFVAPEKNDRLAANYGRAADKSLRLIDDPETSSYLERPSFLAGGSGLTGTTADYLRFCEMLRRGGELDGARILGPRTLRLMTQNHLTAGRDLAQTAVGLFSETAYDGIGFGLGFAMTLDAVKAGSIAAGDYYWGGAASTIFWVDPVEDLVVIFMTQLIPSATFNFRGQLKSIVYSSIVD